MAVGGKILVVEDETLIRIALADTLLDAGYEVIEAGNVLEALAAIGLNDDIDALVTDVDMPGALNGLDLVRLLQVSRVGIAICVTSGRSNLLRLLPAGVAYFPKPARYEEIVDHMDRSIREREAIQLQRIASRTMEG